MQKKIGVLALQGAFAEHIKILDNLGVETSEVRLPNQLDCLDGLIIPGGESTTIAQLLHEWNLHKPICERAVAGMGVWGTCAGAILLAKHGANLKYQALELMDIMVERNAFGRQIDSFITELSFPALGEQPSKAVFIRAPIITAVSPNAKVLIRLENGSIVAAQQEKLLATSFHPELTNDNRFHKYFLQML